MAIDWGVVLGAASVISVPVAVGLTMAATSREEFRFVRACFIVAALLTLATLTWLTFEHPLGPLKLTISAVIGAVVAVSLVAALDWVAKKESAVFGKGERLTEFAEAEVKAGRMEKIYDPATGRAKYRQVKKKRRRR